MCLACLFTENCSTLTLKSSASSCNINNKYYIILISSNWETIKISVSDLTISLQAATPYTIF